jgi:hypothetical protein
MYYMDDSAGRGGTFLLTVVAGVVRRTAVPCKMEKTLGKREGSAGLQNAKDKVKGDTRPAHRRLKVCAADGLGGGGQCQWLSRPVARVGAEAGRNRGRGRVAPAGVGGEVSGG